MLTIHSSDRHPFIIYCDTPHATCLGCGSEHGQYDICPDGNDHLSGEMNIKQAGKQVKEH